LVSTVDWWDWRGQEFQVKILYSRKGVATQILVESKGTFIPTESGFHLLDCGDGTLRDLLGLEEDWIHGLRGVYLSHDHPDHTAGLYALLSFLRLRGRTGELLLATPSQQLELAIKWYRDRLMGGFPFEMKFWRTPGSPSLRLGTVEVRAFPVPHRERTSFFGTAGLVPAVGYAFTGGRGERLVYSGDTGWFAGLRQIFRGADLAIIEATFGQPKGEGRHLTVAQAEELASLARQAILVHR
jgi:ribonuclease BN (tRNA processing enzyme)